MVWHSSIHSGMLASRHCVGLFYAGPFIVHMDGFNVFSIAALCIDYIYFALWSGFFIFDFAGLHSKPYASWLVFSSCAYAGLYLNCVGCDHFIVAACFDLSSSCTNTGFVCVSSFSMGGYLIYFLAPNHWMVACGFKCSQSLVNVGALCLIVDLHCLIPCAGCFPFLLMCYSNFQFKAGSFLSKCLFWLPSSYRLNAWLIVPFSASALIHEMNHRFST